MNEDERERLCPVGVSERLLDRCMPISLVGEPDDYKSRLSQASQEMMATATALGALGGRIDSGLFQGRLEELLSASGSKEQEGSHLSLSAIVMAAHALREAVDDAACNIVDPSDEMAYCVSSKQSCARWAIVRDRMGLAQDAPKAGAAGLALWSKAYACAMDHKAMNAIMVEGRDPSIELRAIAERLARLLGLDDRIIKDLSAWAPYAAMPIKRWGQQISAWPHPATRQPEAQYSTWVVSHCAQQMQPDRVDYPWGVWVALALPEKTESWAARLGKGSAKSDVQLLVAMSSFHGDEEVWSDGHREACARGAARLEAALLGWDMEEPRGIGTRKARI